MRAAVILIIAGAGLSLSLAGCGIRKKQLDKHLEEVKTYERLTSSNTKWLLTSEIYGDSLTGYLNVADSSGSDSTEIESNGIRLKINVTGGKIGTKVKADAVAKPVARSTLSGESVQSDQEKTEQKKSESKQVNKTVNRFNGWFVLVALIAVAWWIISLVKGAKK